MNDKISITQIHLNEARYDKAKRSLKEGNFDEAIAELSKLPSDYRYTRMLLRQARIRKFLAARGKLMLAGASIFLILCLVVGAVMVILTRPAPSPSTPSPIAKTTDTPTSPPTAEPDILPPTTETIQVPASPLPNQPVPHKKENPTNKPVEKTTQELSPDSTAEPLGEPTQEASQEPVQIPAAPSDFQVVEATGTSITLSWTNPVGHYTQLILRQDDTIIAKLPPESQSFTVGNLTCGQSYSFSIVAVNEAGTSESAQLTTQTADCPPSSLSSPDPPIPPPAPPPLMGKIAVPVFENGMYHIYLAEAKNNWQPQLLFERASQPAFTRNGEGMALHSWGHRDWGQRLIYLTNFIDLTSFQNLTNFIEDVHPSFNRQGDEIVYHSRQESRDRNPIIITQGIYPGVVPNKLGEGTNPDWLGERIIYYNSFPQEGLYIMDRNGGINGPIIKTGKTVPAAAPDGDTVAVPLQDESKHWQIFTFTASRGEASLTQLTSTPDADSYLPAWSPDSKYLAFASNRGGTWAVWVMNADGTNQRKLFDLPGPVDGQISDPAIDPALSFGWFEERMSWGP
ncbi:MAG: hypothetical protein D6706_08825 [Chloroflexi bacterium]|nr:MAG: hypothetical protein D6706_08825 [Chloroflexota bacterium]